ncbi:MAG: hypothetical protein ACYC7D_11805 [Nitrososphaerales archaeon]
MAIGDQDKEPNEVPRRTMIAAKKKRSWKKLWVPAVVIGMFLAVGFELVNAINEQASLSPTLMMSMFLTTIPLLIVVVAGLALIMKGKSR